MYVLCHNCDLLGSIDGLALAKEVLVAHAERVEVTTIFVANTTVSVVAITAFSSGAATDASDAARVRGVCRRHRVGFPDVHLTAARAVATSSSVRVVGGPSPVKDISLDYQVNLRENQRFFVE